MRTKNEINVQCSMFSRDTSTFRLLKFVPQSICAKFHFWGQISVDGRSKLDNKFVSVFTFLLGSVEDNLIKAANNTKAASTFYGVTRLTKH